MLDVHYCLGILLEDQKKKNKKKDFLMIFSPALILLTYSY